MRAFVRPQQPSRNTCTTPCGALPLWVLKERCGGGGGRNMCSIAKCSHIAECAARSMPHGLALRRTMLAQATSMFSCAPRSRGKRLLCEAAMRKPSPVPLGAHCSLVEGLCAEFHS